MKPLARTSPLCSDPRKRRDDARGEFHGVLRDACEASGLPLYAIAEQHLGVSETQLGRYLAGTDAFPAHLVALLPDASRARLLQSMTPRAPAEQLADAVTAIATMAREQSEALGAMSTVFLDAQIKGALIASPLTSAARKELREARAQLDASEALLDTVDRERVVAVPKAGGR